MDKRANCNRHNTRSGLCSSSWSTLCGQVFFIDHVKAPTYLSLEELCGSALQYAKKKEKKPLEMQIR